MCVFVNPWCETRTPACVRSCLAPCASLAQSGFPCCTCPGEFARSGWTSGPTSQSTSSKTVSSSTPGEYLSQTGIQRKLNFVSVRTIKEGSSSPCDSTERECYLLLQFTRRFRLGFALLRGGSRIDHHRSGVLSLGVCCMSTCVFLPHAPFHTCLRVSECSQDYPPFLIPLLGCPPAPKFVPASPGSWLPGRNCAKLVVVVYYCSA